MTPLLSFIPSGIINRQNMLEKHEKSWQGPSYGKSVRNVNFHHVDSNLKVLSLSICNLILTQQISLLSILQSVTLFSINCYNWCSHLKGWEHNRLMLNFRPAPNYLIFCTRPSVHLKNIFAHFFLWFVLCFYTELLQGMRDQPPAAFFLLILLRPHQM